MVTEWRRWNFEQKAQHHNTGIERELEMECIHFVMLIELGACIMYENDQTIYQTY